MDAINTTICSLCKLRQMADLHLAPDVHKNKYSTWTGIGVTQKADSNRTPGGREDLLVKGTRLCAVAVRHRPGASDHQ